MTDTNHVAKDRLIRVAVIGNSNSIMRNSFVEVLKQDPRFSVDNMSIGATPNVVLLDVLATAGDLTHDIIVVETAVIDALQGPPGAYPLAIARRNLRIFINSISIESQAKIVFLLIPTRIALLEPRRHNTEEMYLSLAAEFGIATLNLYNLFRQMLGGYSADRVERLSALAPIVAETFSVSKHAVYDLSWSALRDRNLVSNALTLIGFSDHAHVSRIIHRLAGRLLKTWIHGLPVCSNYSPAGSNTRHVQAISPQMEDKQPITRQSTLLSRSLLSLKNGDTAKYSCPPNHGVVGLFLNRSKTSCFVKLDSAMGSIILDCRFVPYPNPWVGVVIPLIDQIGGGEIILSVGSNNDAGAPVRRLPDTQDVACEGCIEVAEMIAVRESTLQALAEAGSEDSRTDGYISIENLASTKVICEETYQEMEMVADGIGPMGIGFSKGLAPLFNSFLKAEPIGSHAYGAARAMLLMGDPYGAEQFLADKIAAGAIDAALPKLHKCLKMFLERSDSEG